MKTRTMYLSAAALLVVTALVVAGCSKSQSSSSAQSSQSSQPAQSAPQTTAPAQEQTQQPAQSAPVTKLEIKDTKVGKGTAAKAGDTVVVEYTGWLADGTKFDSSADHGGTYSFPLGGGQVIKGWDQGVVGMKVGGVRVLTIPPDLAYGAQGAGGVIPPDATLTFQVKLVKIQ